MSIKNTLRRTTKINEITRHTQRRNVITTSDVTLRYKILLTVKLLASAKILKERLKSTKKITSILQSIV